MNSDTYQIVTDRIIAKLNEGTIPWKHYTSLRSEESAPRNYVSDRPYHGINYFLLSMMGYRSPSWITYNQAKALDGQVRKGEKSVPIVYWNFVERQDRETGKAKQIPFLKYFSVFNAEQVEGIDPKFPSSAIERETTPNQEAERIITNMPNSPTIVNGDFPIACYSPSSDTVKMTEQKSCVSDERYYEVLLHELTHSTGHKSRLNREKEMGGWHAFGSKEYSREELVAEMGAAFLCSECGLSQSTIDDSASYIASWLQVLKVDPKAVVMAAGKAQKAADFILGRSYSSE
jgi:antirestriction protein ArdC